MVQPQGFVDLAKPDFVSKLHKSLWLQAYADVDWVGSPLDRHSSSDYVVFLSSTPITWVSKKQCIISRSSTEAEYRCFALPLNCFGFAWYLKIWGFFLANPPILQCDNLSALALASNLGFHARTKHIERSITILCTRRWFVVMLSSNSFHCRSIGRYSL